jgi:hypothetical protein
MLRHGGAAHVLVYHPLHFVIVSRVAGILHLLGQLPERFSVRVGDEVKLAEPFFSRCLLGDGSVQEVVHVPATEHLQGALRTK